jgi:hypothetical protein
MPPVDGSYMECSDDRLGEDSHWMIAGHSLRCAESPMSMPTCCKATPVSPSYQSTRVSLRNAR